MKEGVGMGLFRERTTGAWRTWPALVVTTLLGALLGGLLVMNSRPVYSADIVVALSAERPSTSAAAEQLTRYISSEMEVYSAMVTAPPLLEHVVKEASLDMTPEELAARVVAKPKGQLLTVTVSLPSRESTEQAARALGPAIVEAIDGLHSPGLVRATWVDTRIVVDARSSAPVWFVIAGGVAGLVIGALAVAAVRVARGRVGSAAALAERTDDLVLTAGSDLAVALRQLRVLLQPRLGAGGRLVIASLAEAGLTTPVIQGLVEAYRTEGVTVHDGPSSELGAGQVAVSGAPAIDRNADSLAAAAHADAVVLFVQVNDSTKSVWQAAEMLKVAGAPFVGYLVGVAR